MRGKRSPRVPGAIARQVIPQLPVGEIDEGTVERIRRLAFGAIGESSQHIWLAIKPYREAVTPGVARAPHRVID